MLIKEYDAQKGPQVLREIMKDMLFKLTMQNI